jgi:hypothetical protein
MALRKINQLPAFATIGLAKDKFCNLNEKPQNGYNFTSTEAREN